MDVKGFLRRRVREAAPHLRKLVGQRRDLPVETWGLTRGPSGALGLSGIDLRELVAQYGSPLFVVDGERLRQNASEFLDVPRGHPRGVECFYSAACVGRSCRHLLAIGAASARLPPLAQER